MRFGLVHRVMTNALAALGVMALVASGELGKWVNVAIVLGLVAALSIPESWHNSSWLNRFAQISPFALLATEVSRYFMNRSFLEVAVEFAAALQIVRLSTRRGAAHDQQVILLALLHLIAGTVIGGGLGYGLCFLGFLIVAPGALVLSHLRREVEGNYRQGARDRTGLPVDVPRILRSRRVVGRTFLVVTCCLSVPILVFTMALFLIFPRVGLSLLLLNHSRYNNRMTGFSDKVDLGGVGMLREDPTIALRVDIPDLPPQPPERLPLYLRGTAFDSYDGRGAWSRTNTERRPAYRDRTLVPIERMPDLAHDRKYIILLDPADPPVLFLPPGAVAMDVHSRGEATLLGGGSLRIEKGPEGEYRYRSPEERGLRYEVYISRAPLPPKNALGREDRARYLQIPYLPARIAELATEWTQGASTPLEKARAVEEKLRTGYKYDLGSPSGGFPSPLDHFLFVSKRGHCEFYSTAMAVLLREVGVPTRNVTGFIGGTYNRFSRMYTVRQGDAHSWVEVYLDGSGWVTFDPTPPADAAPRSEIRGIVALLRDMIEASSQRWDRHVVGYNLEQQVGLFERFRELSSARLARIPGLPSPRSLLISAGATGAVAAGLWYYLRRRRLSRRGPLAPAEESRTRVASLAAALYELLDAAMAAQGLARPQGVPPLRHAMSAPVRSHPCAAEILELTDQYLEVRFGGAPLDEAGKREFERRVRAIRAFKAPRAAQLPSPAPGA